MNTLELGQRELEGPIWPTEISARTEEVLREAGEGQAPLAERLNESYGPEGRGWVIEPYYIAKKAIGFRVFVTPDGDRYATTETQRAKVFSNEHDTHVKLRAEAIASERQSYKGALAWSEYLASSKQD